MSSVDSASGRRRGRRRLLAAACGLIGVALVASACSSSGGSGAPTTAVTPAGGGGSTTTSSSSSGSSGQKLTIGLVDFDTTSAGAEVQVKAMQSAFEAQGWKVLNQSSTGDPSKANTICQQYVTEHVSAVVTEVWTSSQLAQCLSAASGANIPVFNAASSLGQGAAGAISTTGAAPINQLFIQNLKKMSDPIVFAINYTPGLPCLQRMQDFDAKMKSEMPNVSITNHAGVIPGAVQDATAATQAFLNGHPSGGSQQIVIWTCDTDQATGALSALRQTGRSGIPIYTWDLGKQAVAPIKSGDFAATLVVTPEGMGKVAVSMINDYLKTKKAKEYAAPTQIVTKANVDQVCQTSPALCQ